MTGKKTKGILAQRTALTMVTFELPLVDVSSSPSLTRIPDKHDYIWLYILIVVGQDSCIADYSLGFPLYALYISAV